MGDRAPRFLLDTNIWRALVDADAGQQLASHAKRVGVTIVMAPAVVYETLALEDVPLRNRILHLQASRGWQRLMPEAFSECEEILAELRRQHPDWLSRDPDLSLYRQHLRDWTRSMPGGSRWAVLGFWNRVRLCPDDMARAISGGNMNLAREGSRAIQVQGRERVVGASPLDGLKARLPTQSPGSEVDAWRWPALAAFSAHLENESDPYHDWLAPWLKIDPRAMGSDHWTRFWLQECDTLAVPRQWLRWAFAYHQSFVKWTPGTPGDEQLSTYLLECDHVVSADKVFVRLVNRVREEAPFVMPFAHQVQGGVAGVSDLLELLGNVATGVAAVSRSESL